MSAASPDPDARIHELLAPLERLSPVTLRRPRRPIPLIALAAALAVVGTATAAAKFGAFDGLSAASRPTTPEDELSPSATAQLETVAPSSDQIGSRLPAEARLVGQLPTGQKVYVVPSSTGKLCLVLASSASSCSDPLSDALPVTAVTLDVDGPGGTPSVTYGLARDGIVAVILGGKRARVVNNFWVVSGSVDTSNVSVEFGDGSREPVQR